MKMCGCGLKSNEQVEHGNFCVHYYNSESEPGIVTGMYECECLRDQANLNASWKDIVQTKYESEDIAACSVAFYFGRHLNYFPLDIWKKKSGIGKSTMCILYHKAKRNGDLQEVDLDLNFSNGGWHINDPLNTKSCVQAKRCDMCLFTNSNRGGYRMMFGLDCSKHCVCELCVYRFFVEKGTPLGNHGTIREPWECGTCGSAMERVVHISIGEEGLVLRAPWPRKYIGQKPIFNKHFANAIGPFYKTHLRWVLNGIITAKEEISMCNEVISGIDEQMSDIEQRDTPFEGTMVSYLNEKQRNWKKALDEWNLVMFWLDYRREHYDFLLTHDDPFPKTFLCHDATYYCEVLDRRGFEVLKKKAEVMIQYARDNY